MKGQHGGARVGAGRKTHTRLTLHTGDVLLMSPKDQPTAAKSYVLGTVTIISKTGMVIKFDDGTVIELYKE